MKHLRWSVPVLEAAVGVAIGSSSEHSARVVGSAQDADRATAEGVAAHDDVELGAQAVREVVHENREPITSIAECARRRHARVPAEVPALERDFGGNRTGQAFVDFLQAGSPNMVAFLDEQDGRIERACGSLVQALGYIGALAGGTIVELCELAYHRVVRRALGEVRERGVVEDVPLLLMRADGGSIPVLASFRRVVQEGSDTPSVRCWIRDVGERTAAANLSVLLDALPWPVLIADEDERVVLANDASAVMLQALRTEILGRTIEHCVPKGAEDDAPLEGRGAVYRREVTMPAGRFSVVAMADSAERGATADALRESEARVRQLGRFAKTMAHELKNMLTVVSGCTEELSARLGPQASSETSEILRDARDGVTRALALSSTLLGFHHTRAGVSRPVDLNVVVTECTRLLRRVVGERIRVNVELSEAPRWVLIDPENWSSVLLNLAMNASDAMPRGGEITIRTSHVEGAAGWTVLEVADTGDGLPDGVAERMFEPFFTTKAAGKGTGLGLAIVREIVEESGGVIDVSSAAGAGTTFRIVLPSMNGATRAPSAGGTEQGGVREPQTILVVDDDELARRATERMLRAEGFEILTAADAEEALRLHDTSIKPVDLLVTDLAMPHVGGSELAETLRDREPGMKVLFVSGHEDLLHESPEAFISKPFTPTVLLREVRQLLESA